jgi:hypothetical protein
MANRKTKMDIDIISQWLEELIEKTRFVEHDKITSFRNSFVVGTIPMPFTPVEIGESVFIFSKSYAEKTMNLDDDEAHIMVYRVDDRVGKKLQPGVYIRFKYDRTPQNPGDTHIIAYNTPLSAEERKDPISGILRTIDKFNGINIHNPESLIKEEAEIIHHLRKI